MKLLYFTFGLYVILSTTSLTLTAQSSRFTVKGRTSDVQGAAVSFSTVTLTRQSDSTRVYGSVSDDRGHFSITAPGGIYRLRASYLGYAPLDSMVTLTGNLDVGTLTLRPSDVKLDAVEVRADMVKREADRFVVDVANTPLAIGRTGKEMLALSPGVWIDEKSGVSINGKSSTKVMVNERVLRESGEELVAYLNNLKAEDIQKIEVIPSTGVDEDADAMGGMVKIHLKRQRDNGMDGSVSMRYGTSFGKPSDYIQPGVNLNYKSNKISLYSKVNYNDYTSGMIVGERTKFYQNDNTIVGEMRDTSTGKNISAQLGSIYEINKHQSVGVEANYSSNNGDNMTTNNQFQTEGDQRTDIYSIQTRPNFSHRLSLSGNYILKMDTVGSTFKFIVDYNRREHSNDQNYHSEGIGFRPMDTTYRSRIRTTNDILALRGDFDIVLSKRSKLTTGVKYTRNGMDNTTLYESLVDDSWGRLEEWSYLNKYTENIGAAYANFSTKFKNNMALTAGLRGEYTYAVPSTSSTLITTKQNYFGLFPNANLMMPLNKKASHMLIASYNRKIERPSFWQLNPYRFAVSEFLYNEGNPYLKPAYRNDISLSYVFKQKYNLTAGVTLTDGSIQQVAQTDPTNPDIIIMRQENVQNNTMYYLSLNLPVEVTKWWRLNSNLTGFVTQNEILGETSQITSFQGNLSNTFTIAKVYSLNVEGNYMAPFLWGNMHIASMYGVNIGVSRTFLKKRLSASIYLNNVFDSQRTDVTINTNNFQRAGTEQSGFRRLGLSVRYNFKAGKDIRVRNVESGASEEKSRL